MRTLAALLLLAGVAHAAPAVFTGDPVQPSTGAAWRILAGAPLVSPGPDDKWGTSDDVVNPAVVGDVDLVVRLGGTFTGPSIPPPASDLAHAVPVTAGGTATGVGDEVAWQAILSDGLGPFAWGNPLLVNDLDGRGVFIAAWADLDGDGRVGPWSGDGTADDAIEREEPLLWVGRQMGMLSGGVAQATMALQVGLPASVGGLGVAVGGGAMTGSTATVLYSDGPWIATTLPFVPQDDVLHILGGTHGAPPLPTTIVDLELAPERMFTPASTDPVLHDALAIPLDGSEPSVDLLRVLSGPAAGVAFAQDLDPATFVADPAAAVRPLVGPAGERRVVGLVDRLGLATDASGHAQTVWLFPSDLLANQADPPAGGWSVTLVADADLRIVAPDADGDPTRETIAFTSPRAVALTVDGAGSGSITDRTEHVVATRAGLPVGALRIDLGAGGPGPGGGGPADLAPAKAVVKRSPLATRGKVTLTAAFATDPATIDPTTQPVSVTLTTPSAQLVSRTLAAGTMTAKKGTYQLAEPKAVTSARVRSLKLAHVGTRHTVKLVVTGLDLTALPADTPALTATLTVGPQAFAGTLACTAKGSTLRCLR